MRQLTSNSEAAVRATQQATAAALAALREASEVCQRSIDRIRSAQERIQSSDNLISYLALVLVTQNAPEIKEQTSPPIAD